MALNLVLEQEDVLKTTSKVFKAKQKRIWMAYSARAHAVFLTLSLPMLARPVLKVHEYSSQHREDFVTLSSNSSLTASLIRCGSTWVILIIATLFYTLDFAIATITPFSSLRSADPSAHRTIVDDLSPTALCKTTRNRHVGAASSLLSSLIDSVLNVVVSGLWLLSDSWNVGRDASGTILSAWDV